MTHLRRALDLLPDDPQALFGLATALEQLGTREADEEADGLNLRLIEEHPNLPMVEQAEKAQTTFAHKRLKSSSVGGFRLDVMSTSRGRCRPSRSWGHRSAKPSRWRSPRSGATAWTSTT